MRKIVLLAELIPAYHLIKRPAAARVRLVATTSVAKCQHENRKVFGWINELVSCEHLCRAINQKSLDRTRINPPLRRHQHGKAKGDIRLMCRPLMKPSRRVHQLKILLSPLLPECFVGSALDQIHFFHVPEYVIDVAIKRLGCLGGKNEEMAGVKAGLVDWRAFFQILAQLLILGNDDVELLKAVRGWRQANCLKDQLHILIRDLFIGVKLLAGVAKVQRCGNFRC